MCDQDGVGCATTTEVEGLGLTTVTFTFQRAMRSNVGQCAVFVCWLSKK